MGLLPNTQNCGLCMRQECRERFPRHRRQSKPLISYPGMHHGTCVTHVPRCMSGSLTRGGGESNPGIPGACATLLFANLSRDSRNTILHRSVLTIGCNLMCLMIIHLTQMWNHFPAVTCMQNCVNKVINCNEHSFWTTGPFLRTWIDCNPSMDK